MGILKGQFIETEYNDDCQGWWAGKKERQWSKIIEVRTK